MPTRTRPAGIFCVEADWSPDLTDQASVRDMLELLERVDDIPFIHEPIGASREALTQALATWSQKRYARYSIGYFASHGKPGTLLLGRTTISLDQLAEILAGRCTGRVLYFSSCSVLRIPDADVDAFRAATCADAVIGFTRDVGWVASAALDMILLEALAHDPKEAAVDKWLRKEYGALAGHLGLKMIFAPTP